jgi:hypothetical protein
MMCGQTANQPSLVAPRALGKRDSAIVCYLPLSGEALSAAGHIDENNSIHLTGSKIYRSVLLLTRVIAYVRNIDARRINGGFGHGHNPRPKPVDH